MTSTMLTQSAEGWAMVDALGAWLLVASVQVGLLGAVVAILDRVLMNRVWPQIRAAMWWMVLLALVVPPMFDSPVSLWRQVDPAAELHEALQPAAARSPGDIRIEDIFERAPQEVDPAGAPDRRLILRATVVVWLAGFVSLMAATGCRVSRERRRWLATPGKSPPAWLSPLANRVADRLGMRRSLRISVQRDAAGAAVVGLIHPTVILPATLLQKATHEQVEHVLMHEFAHVQRRDALASFACSLIHQLYWFHPVAWLARARLETLREICCDQAVVCALQDRDGSYRRTLLRLARSLVMPQAAPASLAFVHRHSQILSRLLHLQRPLPNRPRVVNASATALLAVLLLCCVPRVAPPSRPAESASAMRWDDLPGCFQLRYAVMRAMAEQSARAQSD
jgi:beta-lactamase regulating signal transducer with metallopeptidase domain